MIIVNPLIPIGAYSGHPRALRSSTNDSGHTQGHSEKVVGFWPANPPKLCGWAKKLSPKQVFSKLDVGVFLA